MDSREPGIHTHHFGFFPGLMVLIWMFGPVRWVAQSNPGLSELDIKTHLLAIREYGFHFVLSAALCSVLYLHLLPYLGKKFLKLLDHAWQWRKTKKGGVH